MLAEQNRQLEGKISRLIEQREVFNADRQTEKDQLCVHKFGEEDWGSFLGETSGDDIEESIFDDMSYSSEVSSTSKEFGLELYEYSFQEFSLLQSQELA